MFDIIYMNKSFIFYDCPEDELLTDDIINCNTIKCSLCDWNNYIACDEMNYNPNNINSITVTAPCCQAILCPNCFILDHENKTITAKYLFAESIIYLQDDEILKLIELENCTYYNNDIQYRWGLYKLLDKNKLNKYKIVDNTFNNYPNCKNIKQSQFCKNNKNEDYTFVHALCECKSCGFKCTSVNYMSS